MDWRHLFLGFSGRLNRQPFWIGSLVIIAGLILTGILGALLLGVEGGFMIFGLAALLSTLPSVAIGVKRLHDRDKSGWWLLLFYLTPSILQVMGEGVGEGTVLLVTLANAGLSIWAFVELGCLRGTPGPNRYGPDPLLQPVPV